MKAYTYKDLPQPDQPSPQVQEYLEAFRKGLTGRFVLPNDKGWYVNRPDGSKRSLFATKPQAIKAAKKQLTKTKGELFIFNRNLKIASRSFPSDTK